MKGVVRDFLESAADFLSRPAPRWSMLAIVVVALVAWGL